MKCPSCKREWEDGCEQAICVEMFGTCLYCRRYILTEAEGAAIDAKRLAVLRELQQDSEALGLYDDKPCAECGIRPAFDGMWHKPDCPTLNHPIQKPAPPMTGGGDCSGNAIAAESKSGARDD